MTIQSRAFCFTTNNYDLDDEIDASSLYAVYGARYLIIGYEKGEQGTPHLQCYVYFDTMKSFKQLKKIISRSHIEIAKGTPQQNFDYCSKEDYIEFGSMPVQGKRSDLIDMVDEIHTGVPINEIMQKYPSNFMRYSGSIEKAYAYSQKQRSKCQIIYTTHDPFETRAEILNEAYIIDSLQIDLHGYRGEKYIIYMHNPSFDILRRFLHNIPITIKNGYIQTKQLPKYVIIYDTHGFHYSNLLKDEEKQKYIELINVEI